MHPVVKQLALEYKDHLVRLYGAELDSLILFGSYARDDFDAARHDLDVNLTSILEPLKDLPAKLLQ